MSAITTTNLTKRYGDLIAVDNLSLSVEEGELFALLGVNGAGKTTAIKMLSCLIKPTSGNAQVLGSSIIHQSQAVKQQTNISPQETAVAPNLTVSENLELVAGIYGQNSKTARQSTQDIAQRFGLTSMLKRRARTLSGGMQRRLSVALALISNPRILFLDEPTLGLDVLARRELWATIKSLKGKVTIMLTTHYLEEVEVLSDRIGVMTNGRLVAVGSVAELKTQTDMNTLEDAFVSLSGGVI